MATENQASSTVQPSRSGAVVGLFWASGMLGLFALWLHKGHADKSIAVIALVWILAACSLLLGIWQVRTAGQTLDATADERRRRMLGRLLLLGGVVLAALAIYLLVVLGLDGFAEGVGLGLFTLVPLIGGCSLLVPAQTKANFFPALVKQSVILQNVLLAIGVVCLGAFIWLAFGVKIGTDYLPQLAALVFEGLLAFTCAIWLLTAGPDDRTPLSLRCLVLIFGGVTGLILTLLACSLTYFWRQDIVLGGLNAWKGENGYRIWVCAYLALIGLVLMFGSVLVTRTAVRTHFRLRQVLYGYNAVVNGLLLLAVLVVINVLTYAAFPMNIEWNKGGLTTLSPSTKSFLANMKEPVTVYVLMPELENFGDIRTLLGNCQVLTDKLKVNYVADNDRDTYAKLVRRFPELVGGNLMAANLSVAPCLLIVVGTVGDDVTAAPPPHAIIPERKLFDVNFDQQTGTQKQTFNGEAEFMRQLSFLLQGRKQRKVYILQGNDELDIAVKETYRRKFLNAPMKPLGAETLVSRLRKDNYKVEGLSFGFPGKDKQPDLVFAPETGPDGRKDVPEDAWVVIVPGASKPIPPEVFNALDRCMAHGKRLLVTLDLVLNPNSTALEQSGMEGYLKKYGVNVDDSFVLGLPNARSEDPLRVYASAPANSDNVVARQFLGELFGLDSARVVRPSSQGKYKDEVLLQVEPEKNAPGILEDSSLRALSIPLGYLIDLRNRNLLRSRLSKEPLPVAVAVSEQGSHPDDVARPRLVVFGDTEFISNAGLAQNEMGYALFASALEWMSERQDFIGPRPRESQVYVLSPKADLDRMRFLPTWFMILGIFGLGIGVWLVRRR